MGLPETMHVKLSSEEAGDISFTAVVNQEIRLAELVDMMLGVTGKDLERVHELLRRGTLVSGGSRLRWEGWDAPREELAELLSTFPDAEPARPFSPERCVRALLKGPYARIEITRETGEARRMFHHSCFWDALMDAAAAGRLEYLDYSYRHRADRYELALTSDMVARLKARSNSIRYSTLEAHVRDSALHAIEFHVARR
jgi:hypothetical protein